MAIIALALLFAFAAVSFTGDGNAREDADVVAVLLSTMIAGAWLYVLGQIRSIEPAGIVRAAIAMIAMPIGYLVTLPIASGMKDAGELWVIFILFMLPMTIACAVAIMKIAPGALRHVLAGRSTLSTRSGPTG